MVEYLTAIAISAQTLSKDCALAAEQYVSTGYSQPGVYRGRTEHGDLIYHVRTNDNGGDAAYEVIMTAAQCELVSIRLLWSE